MENVLFFIAIIPIVWLMVSLGKLKLPAHLTCFFTMIFTIVLSITVFKMSPILSLTAALEGAFIGLWPIMIVIVAAIFTYNLALYTKSMEVIKKILSNITTDKRVQVILLAWGFGGFLEAVAGYGTAVAIPASILASLGFNPLFAATICLIANTVPTAFGAVGIPVTTLAKVTGLNIELLSYSVALQLSLFIIIIPFVLIIITTKSIKGLKGVSKIALAAGLAFAVPQLLAAKYLGAELPALLGSICSMSVTIFLAKAKESKETLNEKEYNQMYLTKEANTLEDSQVSFKEGFIAWLPYMLILVFIILTSQLFPSINETFSSVKSSFQIYQGEAGEPTSFKWIATPGVLIILATVIGGIIQGAKLKEIANVFISTIKQLSKSIVTVVSIVSMAKVMAYSGMITSIAIVLVKVTGGFFPIIAPIIGALGTFVTGSDTSSNILFGALQTEVAGSLGIDPYWLAAANTSGATAGKMISPQSIAVATSATGMVGSEGKIFNKTVKFCLVYVLALGILVYIGGILI